LSKGLVELEIFAPPEFEWVRYARGVEELSAAIAHNFGSRDEQRPAIQNVITQADTVLLFGHERGDHPCNQRTLTTCSSCSDSRLKMGGFGR